jgi:hypothetical protein
MLRKFFVYAFVKIKINAPVVFAVNPSSYRKVNATTVEVAEKYHGSRSIFGEYSLVV